MSKGSQVVTVRIPAELLERMVQAVVRSQATRSAGPLTRSSFIVAAIREKIDKMARSAGKKSDLPPSYRRDSYTFGDGGVIHPRRRKGKKQTGH